jgi:hypothetical protein
MLSTFPPSTRVFEEVVRYFSTIQKTDDFLSECDRGVMEMDIPAYRIHHISQVCTGKMKNPRIHASKKTISSSSFHEEIEFSSDPKKRQLIDQLISEAVTQLTKRLRNRKGPKIVDGIAHDILLEDGKRELYGFLM